MMRSPGFMLHLQQDFERMPLDLLKRIDRPGGLEVQALFESLLKPEDHTVYEPDAIEPQDLASSDVRPDMAIVTYTDDLSGVSCHTTLDPQKIFLRHHETPLLTPSHTLHQPVTLVPCGTGDILPLLEEAGLIDVWRSAGIQHLYVSHIPSIDWDLVASHAAAGLAVTCRVKPAAADDEVLVGRHAGIEQLISRFRIQLSDPVETPEDRLCWAWSGSAVIDIRVDTKHLPFRWHRRRSISNGHITYGLHRLFEDVTVKYRTHFVK